MQTCITQRGALAGPSANDAACLSLQRKLPPHPSSIIIATMPAALGDKSTRMPISARRPRADGFASRIDPSLPAYLRSALGGVTHQMACGIVGRAPTANTYGTSWRPKGWALA